jgi:hypothetical protein
MDLPLITKTTCRNARRGHALVLTLVFAAISLLLLAAVIGRTTGSALVCERNNAYNRAVSAAESATETVFAGMARDFLNQSIDYSQLGPYRALVPGSFVTNGWPAQYEFSDNAGALNQTGLISTGPSVVTNLDAPYQGLYGIAFPFRVTSKAMQISTSAGSSRPIAAAVQQDFQLASIPVFQFLAFYSLDLEVNPSPQMTLTGKVHGNANVYLAPVTGLEFVDTVEAVGDIIKDRKPDDPQHGSTKVDPTFDKGSNTNANSLTLPIGTNNTPADVAKVIDPPPAGENARSPMGQQRYYNQVDLIVTTSPLGIVSVRAGLWDSSALIPPDAGLEYSFVAATNIFYDAREAKTNLVTQIDVGKFNQWLTNASLTSGASLNTAAQSSLGHQINSIYVDDQRVAANKLTVVRVTNGQQLPPDGLTLATDLPLYVKGNYNATDLTAGSTNTVNTKPASLVGDAINILSTNWSDAKSLADLNANMSRLATDTTVNAALVAGIVQTTNSSGTKYYSGGLENYPRFLENWSGRTLTYNGSMVAMFESRRAKTFWNKNAHVYNPPIRKWAFDQNFLVQSRLPPCTPQVRKLLRGQWTTIAAN